MSTDPQRDLAYVLGCDVASLNVAEAVQALTAARHLRGVVDHFEAAVASRLDALHAEGRSAPADDVLTRREKISAAEARKRSRRAKALERARSFGEALAAGAVGAEHADALANATTKLDETLQTEFFGHEDDLLARATTTSPEQFARHCRQLVARLERDQGIARNEQQRRDTRLSCRVGDDGMHHLNGVFHPELGAKLFKAIDEQVAALVAAGGDRSVDRAQLAAVALGEMVGAGRQTVQPGEPEVLAIIDRQTLEHGEHEHTICETDTGAMLPPETVRRMCCQGRITPVYVRDGIPLDLGREQRLASRAQRRALRTMYRSCGFGGCDVAFNRCEIHHIIPFQLGGVTDLANLIPLCSRHHHLVHELGWTLELAPDRELTIRQPDGSIFAVEPIQIRPNTRQHADIHDLCEHARRRARELRRCQALGASAS